MATGGPAAGPVEKLRILVADDDDATRELVRMIFESQGFSVLVAENGLEAAAIARSQAIDAIITDYEMPGLNGAELCREVRRNAERGAAECPPMVGSSRVDLQACKLEYSIVSPK